MKKLSVCLLMGILLFSSFLPASSVSVAFAASGNQISEGGIMKVPMEKSTSENNIEMLSQEELSQSKELSTDLDENNKKSPRNTVNGAITIETDTVYNTTVPSDNSVWIKVNTAGKKKLTMVAQFNNNVSFATNIYELTDSTTLTRVQHSQNFMDKVDAISFIPNGGWYYIQIAYNSGDRNVTFLVETSNSASNKEPNDNIYQAPTYNNYINVVDTFDSYRDQDWSILDVTSPGTYYVAAMFKTVYQGPVLINIIELATGEGYYVHENTPIVGAYVDLPRTGSYAVRITSDNTVNPSNEYVLTVAKENEVITPDNVTISRLSNEKNETITNSSGSYYVTGTSIKVQGYLKKNGKNLAYAPVLVCLQGSGDNNTKLRANFTDANGIYRLDPNLPSGKGTCSMVFYDFAANQIGRNIWYLNKF